MLMICSAGHCACWVAAPDGCCLWISLAHRHADPTKTVVDNPFVPWAIRVGLQWGRSRMGAAFAVFGRGVGGVGGICHTSGRLQQDIQAIGPIQAQYGKVQCSISIGLLPEALPVCRPPLPSRCGDCRGL